MHFKVKMGGNPRVAGISALADCRNSLALSHPLTDLDMHRLKVGIEAAEVVTMFQFHEPPKPPMLTDLHHGPASDGVDRTSQRRFNVNASMAPVAAPGAPNRPSPFASCRMCMGPCSTGSTTRCQSK